jgi:ribonuclease G
LLNWFRRRRPQREEAPTEAVVAPAEVAPPPEPPADEAGEETQAQRAKRRRGNRGGRGRSKKTATDTSPPARQETAAGKPERRSEERERPAQAERKQQRAQRRRLQPKRAALPPAKRELLVSVDVGEQRVAVLEDSRVAEVYLERPEKRSIAGNIYLGIVDNVLPGMEAAFVEIGLEKNGFLYVDEIVVPELEGKRHGKKIQDLIARGQTILVQAVKDPMKSKGARLTTEISLPGRFVVFVPSGEGLGVSRRLPDDERIRLRDILKALEIPEGGVIVRTAAEGASAEDIERDLVFLQRLWKTIQERAGQVKAPALVYQEAELPLRVVRDLFTGEFEKAYVDHERTHKRIVGYLKKTSPHMVERVVRHKEKTPLFESFGVDAEIRSTLSRRVDLPSGGYLVFDYAEAFTVIDVNTGRFVGSRSKTSGGRLEDTITKNNLEAVKEVVRQLRLRDIGGIIVIDFIDMANPKNRATVEDALRTELERDRTKTYVVEISPLGLVEMTRQNVTDGPREILTKKCPSCGGDGVVFSEASAAVEVERRLKALVLPGARAQAFRVEVNAKVASRVIGPGAARLAAIEEQARRKFFLVGRDDVELEHFLVVDQGKLEDVAPKAPVEEGQELELKLVELGRHDTEAAVGKVDGYDVCVGDAAKLVGKKARVRVERVLDGIAHATRIDAAAAAADGPLTAEAEAEKPTRRPPARKAAAPAVELEDAEAEVDETGEAEGEGEGEEDEAKPKKRTRRGTRGGRGRKKKTATAEGAEAPEGEEVAAEAETAAEAEAEPVAAAEGPEAAGEPAAEAAAEAAPEPEPEPEAIAAGDGKPRRKAKPRIHVPDPDLGEADEDEEEPAAAGVEASENGDEPKPKKRTRRGTRGGRNRKRKTAEDGEENGVPPAAAGAETAAPAVVAGTAVELEEAAGAEPAEAATQAVLEAEPDAQPATQAVLEVEPDTQPADDWGYVPMSEWEDEI